jgi:hypothetical protein
LSMSRSSSSILYYYVEPKINGPHAFLPLQKSVYHIAKRAIF